MRLIRRPPGSVTVTETDHVALPIPIDGSNCTGNCNTGTGSTGTRGGARLGRQIHRPHRHIGNGRHLHDHRLNLTIVVVFSVIATTAFVSQRSILESGGNDSIKTFQLTNREDANRTDSDTTGNCHDHENFYRYSNVRMQTNILGTHQFLVQELKYVLSFSTLNTGTSSATATVTDIRKRPQLMIGRFGTSESEIMEYAIALSSNNANDSKNNPIPSNFYTPGYYFSHESTLHERQMTVKRWGDQRIRSYGDMNLFAVLDWSSSNQHDTTVSSTTRTSHMLQMTQIEQYAPLSGYLHANSVMYPPCLTIPSHFDRTHAKMTSNLSDTFNLTDLSVVVPWTMQLENKIVLIIHPFIDTMRHNIPKLQKIWSNVPSDIVKGAPYSCFPNVTEFKFLRTPLPKARDNNSISWFDTLDLLRQMIDQIGYFDIALLGCGGYGLPIMSYLSTLSFAPSAIYVGGALQLFFGIHGTRWSVQNHNHYYEMWASIYNDAWIWPFWSDIENSTLGTIENGAYIQPNQAINLHATGIRRHRWFDPPS